MGGVGRALPLGTVTGGVGRHWRITEGSARIKTAGLEEKKKGERFPAETKKYREEDDGRRGNLMYELLLKNKANVLAGSHEK